MKKYMKKTRKMNKERKLKCKQVWGKQIKLNNIPWTNTCNNSFTINVIILYTVLRGSALFKGSMQNIVIWESWHKFWCSAIKLHRCFQNKQKLKKQHKFINFYWSFLAFIDNIAQMAKIFVQLHGPRKEWTINHSEIKRNPSVTHQYCFIQHIQLLPNSEK